MLHTTFLNRALFPRRFVDAPARFDETAHDNPVSSISEPDHSGSDSAEVGRSRTRRLFARTGSVVSLERFPGLSTGSRASMSVISGFSRDSNAEPSSASAAAPPFWYEGLPQAQERPQQPPAVLQSVHRAATEIHQSITDEEIQQVFFLGPYTGLWHDLLRAGASAVRDSIEEPFRRAAPWVPGEGAPWRAYEAWLSARQAFPDNFFAFCGQKQHALLKPRDQAEFEDLVRLHAPAGQAGRTPAFTSELSKKLTNVVTERSKRCIEQTYTELETVEGWPRRRLKKASWPDVPWQIEHFLAPADVATYQRLVANFYQTDVWNLVNSFSYVGQAYQKMRLTAASDATAFNLVQCKDIWRLTPQAEGAAETGSFGAEPPVALHFAAARLRNNKDANLLDLPAEETSDEKRRRDIILKNEGRIASSRAKAKNLWSHYVKTTHILCFYLRVENMEEAEPAVSAYNQCTSEGSPTMKRELTKAANVLQSVGHTGSNPLAT